MLFAIFYTGTEILQDPFCHLLLSKAFSFLIACKYSYHGGANFCRYSYPVLYKTYLLFPLTFVSDGKIVANAGSTYFKTKPECLSFYSIQVFIRRYLWIAFKII